MALEAIFKGEDYQGLVFWYYAMKLLASEENIKKVEFETVDFKSLDDLVIRYNICNQGSNGITFDTDYIQIKFHSVQDKTIKFASLVDPAFINAKKNSFLDRIANAYKKDRKQFLYSRFIFFSNYYVDSNDPLCRLVSQYDGSLVINNIDEIDQPIKKKFLEKHQITEDDFKTILSHICVIEGPSIYSLISNLNGYCARLRLPIIDITSSSNIYIGIYRNLLEKKVTAFDYSALVDLCNRENIGTNTISNFDEAQYLVFISQCFDRRAYRVKYDFEDDTYEFLSAIKDTIKAITTGKLYSRDKELLGTGVALRSAKNATIKREITEIRNILEAMVSDLKIALSSTDAKDAKKMMGKVPICIIHETISINMDTSRINILERLNILLEEYNLPALETKLINPYDESRLAYFFSLPK